MDNVIITASVIICYFDFDENTCVVVSVVAFATVNANSISTAFVFVQQSFTFVGETRTTDGCVIVTFGVVVEENGTVILVNTVSVTGQMSH